MRTCGGGYTSEVTSYITYGSRVCVIPQGMPTTSHRRCTERGKESEALTGAGQARSQTTSTTTTRTSMAATKAMVVRNSKVRPVVVRALPTAATRVAIEGN